MSVSVSTACVQVQGSTKRVADVCRLLKTVLGDNTLWSIDIGGNFTSSGAAKGDCVVLVERECRVGAMRVLIGGKNRNMLLEIEHKTGAKIKFVSNKQLKLYIQGGRSQVKAARLEIEQRLVKLGLGLITKKDDIASPPQPPLTKTQLLGERRNAKTCVCVCRYAQSTYTNKRTHTHTHTHTPTPTPTHTEFGPDRKLV